MQRIKTPKRSTPCYSLENGKRPLVQSSTEDWRKQWQDLVPPECCNVPVTVDGKTMTAYVQINHFVMMLQDGLLMQQGFFDVCAHFSARGLPRHLADALHAGHCGRLSEAA